MKKSILITVIIALLVNLSYVTGSENESEGENTKVYTVFLSQGYLHTGGPVEHPLTNEDVLNKLRDQCSGIDFIVRDLTQEDISRESLLDEMEESKENLDGVLIIGTLSQYKLAFTGLPTIVVWNLWEWDKSPYKLFARGGNVEEKTILKGGLEYKDGKIITAQIDRLQVSEPSRSEAMFEDLVDKIELIQAIKKLKDTRILSVSPHHNLAQVDYQGDINKRMPEDYNETYMREVKEKLGVEIVRREPEEFYEAYEEADENEAKKIAEKWMEEAMGVKAAKSEIIKTARAYLAFDALREKYDCNAVSTHMRSVTGSGEAEDMFWPGLGLECGFKTRGIQAVCQDYPNVLIAQLLGYYMTGRPSMLGDLMVDTENSFSILLHCGCPINPYGDERRVPYVIRTHAESPLRETLKPGSSTGMQVFWPKGEPVTIWKVYPLLDKIGFHTGQTVDGYAHYENYKDIVCRNKLIAKVEDPENIQKHYFADSYGIHRAATLGDLEERIKDLATLIGFEVMEEEQPLPAYK
ncbi:MAG: hypothetical protein V5A59_12875, partial [Bacteroidales bacterium]